MGRIYANKNKRNKEKRNKKQFNHELSFKGKAPYLDGKELLGVIGFELDIEESNHKICTFTPKIHVDM